jgi:hypothetical protein
MIASKICRFPSMFGLALPYFDLQLPSLLSLNLDALEGNALAGSARHFGCERQLAGHRFSVRAIK